MVLPRNEAVSTSSLYELRALYGADAATSRSPLTERLWRPAVWLASKEAFRASDHPDGVKSNVVHRRDRAQAENPFTPYGGAPSH